MTDLRAHLREVAKVVGAPVWRRLRPRIESIAAERVAPRFADLESRVQRVADDLRRDLAALRADLLERAERMERGLADLRAELEWQDSQQRRIAPQVAALESRFADVEHAVPRQGGPSQDGTVGADGEVGTAAALVAEIRVEHAKVRTRLGMIARYEERLSRLEDAKGA